MNTSFLLVIIALILIAIGFILQSYISPYNLIFNISGGLLFGWNIVDTFKKAH